MAIAPAVVAIAGIVASAAGTAYGVYASMQQAKQAEGVAKFNAAVQRNNQMMAQERANFEADRARRRGRVLLGRQRASLVKSGVTLGGTADDIIYDSSVQSELDVMAAMYSGKVEMTNFGSAAERAKIEGDVESSRYKYQAGATLLSGAGSAASGYGNYLRIRDDNSNPQFN